jgi:hypothetical protein
MLPVIDDCFRALKEIMPDERSSLAHVLNGSAFAATEEWDERLHNPFFPPNAQANRHGRS